MSLFTVGTVLLAFLLIFLCGGVWIAIALAMVGWIAMQFFTGNPAGLNLITAYWQSSASWELAALPLFVWMGEILFRTRLSEQMFKGLAPWLGWLPGRLMHVNVIGSGIFGAICGSSAATCATIAKISLPELKRRGYDERIALGSLAGSGTLGLLIPPSIMMIVYAVAAEVSIIKIFLAGFLPGLVVMVLFSGFIAAWSLAHPERVPPNDMRMSFLDKLKASRELIPCVLLIVSVMALIVMGVSTPTEGAAFGVVGALVMAAWTRSLTWKSFRESLFGATRLSCMIMFILAGAAYLSLSMGFTEIPRAIAEWVVALNPDRYLLLGILAAMYIILGTALDGVSMVVLTTSIVLPMVQRLGIDLVWFGIFIILLVEIAEVTPPVGFGLFVLQTMSGKDSTYVARAAIPFFFMLVLAIVIITAFPSIVTLLPDMVVGK